MRGLRALRSKWARFARLDGRRRTLLLEAVLWLALARLVLLLVPFPYIARRLGIFSAPAAGLTKGRPEDPPPGMAGLARDIGWAVTRAARHVPFKAVCLPQALAAKIMLRRRRVSAVLYFGVARAAEGPIEAHAWLLAAGVEVTGYPVAERFTPIACFV
jgi:hypothetical protein